MALGLRDGDRGGMRQRTLADTAFSRIHDAILTGELKPGQRLPIEDVAQQLDMSPMPVREALRRLDADGLVEHIPHRGARVTDLSLADLAEIYDARLALETLAMEKAAVRAGDEDLAGIESAFQRFRKARGDRRRPAHTEFHFSLYAAAHSRLLLRLITPLWESAERYRLAMGPRGRPDWRIEEHERLMAAVIERDGKAASDRMHDHLAVTANELAVQMGGRPLFELRARAGAP